MCRRQRQRQVTAFGPVISPLLGEKRDAPFNDKNVAVYKKEGGQALETIAPPTYATAMMNQGPVDQIQRSQGKLGRRPTPTISQSLV